MGKTIKAVRPEDDLAETAASLRKLSALKMAPLVLFTALGRVFENGREAREGFDRFISDLSQKAKDLQTRGRSIQEIMAELFEGENPMASLTDHQFTTENLIRSVLKMP